MCGIAGIIPADRSQTGSILMKMLEGLQHRGPDSTGIGIYKENDIGGFLLRVSTRDSLSAERLKELLNENGKVKNIEYTALENGGSFRFVIPVDNPPVELVNKVCSIEGIEIHSIGRRLEIMKDVGTISGLAKKFNICSLSGTHGIGHVRLGTESKVDRNYSHPFQSLNLPDISIVHNGQITNYYNLRRRLERRGYIFRTENDSELIAQIAAYHLQAGNDLDVALKNSLEELDGTFSFIVATPDKLGIVKDHLGAKPMMVGENKKGLAIASEEISIRKALGDEVSVVELPPGEVRTWHIS